MTDDEDLRNKADRIADLIHDAVIAVHEDKCRAILIGNPDDRCVNHYREMYQLAGYEVNVESKLQTCAIGGMTFHTIAVDELERVNAASTRLRLAMEEVKRSIIKRAATAIVNEYLPQILKPKNQPHGPRRKGRGGKTRKW